MEWNGVEYYMTWIGEDAASGVMIYSEDGSPGSVVGSNGKVLAWENSLPSFIGQASLTGVAPSKLNQIGNVDSSGVITGDNLQWNGVKWVPASIGGPFNSFHAESGNALESFTSTQFQNITGASGTLITQTETAVVCWFSFDADSGAGGGEELEVRVFVSGVTTGIGEEGLPFSRDLSGAADIGIGVGFAHAHPIPANEEVQIFAQMRSLGGSEIRIRSWHLYGMTEEGTVGPTGPVGPIGPSGAPPTYEEPAFLYAFNSAQSGAGFPTSPTPLGFDRLDHTSQPTKLRQHPTNNTKFEFLEAGPYAVSYQAEGEQDAQLINIACYLNGVQHSGSLATGGEHHHPQAHEYFINKLFFHDFEANDFIQIMHWADSTDSATVDAFYSIAIWSLAGAVGPAGPAGADGADGVDGSGDLTGPGSSIPQAIAVFNGSTGKLIDDQQVIIGASGHVHNAKTYTFETEYDWGNSGASANLNWAESQKQKITLNAATPTLTFTNPSGVGNFLLKLVQDGTGGRVPSWPSSVKWAGGTAPDLASSTGNQTDITTFYFDGTNYYGVGSLDFF